MPKYSQHGVFKSLIKDPGFWGPMAAAGAGLGVTAAAGAIGRMREAKRKAVAYKEMLNIHPQLKGRDPVLVGRIYNSLHNVNPTMAKDPMVAGAWVDTIVESGGLDAVQSSRALLDAVKDLSGIRSQMASAARSEAGPGPGAAVERLVDRGITRYREVDKEHGEIASLKGQLKGVQERQAQEKVTAYADRVARNLGHAAQQYGMDQKQLLEAVAQGAFKTSAARRLSSAIRKRC
jgi:hypothetical protein